MRKLFFAIVLLQTLIVGAQRQDFQTWWTGSVQGELFKKVDFELSSQLRLFQNSTSLKSALFDVNLSYPITKFVEIGGKYRFQNKHYYDGVDYLANRGSAYAQFRYKIKRFRLRYRAMYQIEVLGLNTREFGDIPIHEHRHKFALSYFRKKWDLRPTVSSEFFFVRKPDFIVSEKKYRITGGASYKFNKELSVGLYYRYQHEFFASNPWDVHIISTKLNFRL